MLHFSRSIEAAFHFRGMFLGTFLGVLQAGFGLDSAAAVGITGELEQWLGRRLSPTLVYSYPTIATLAHHIKNILQGIRGGSYLIEMGLSDDENDVVRKGWDIVEKNQERISKLVMDMLSFSKEREPDPEPSDLNVVTAEVIEIMKARADEQNVELRYAPAEQMPTLLFDAEGLHIAILNVVTNAVDACEGQSQGRVHVSTQFDDRRSLATITVTDNGIGMRPEELEKIFTIFVSKKGSRGTGLGLPVSRKIMHEHGGQIFVESKPGDGSTFVLELPAAAAPKQPRSSTADTMAPQPRSVTSD